MDEDLKTELDGWSQGLGIALDPAQWKLLDAFMRDVLDYNQRVNITADDDEGKILLRHVADGLQAVSLLRRRFGADRPAPSLLDLGAGAGFVGIAVKVARPEAAVTLLEASRRKFQFLNWTAARLAVKNLRVAYGRAPQALGGKTYDAVLVRALAPLEETLQTAMPLVRSDGGVLAVYQTHPPDFQTPPLTQALARSGAEVDGVIPYRLPRESQDRHLTLFRHKKDHEASGSL